MTGTKTSTKTTSVFKAKQTQKVVREIYPKRLKLVVREWVNSNGSLSKVYRARIYDPNREKYAYFTLSAETESAAISQSIDLYAQKSSALEQKLPIGRDAKKLDHYIDKFMDHMEIRCKNGHVTPHRVVCIRQLLRSLEKFYIAHKSPEIIDLPLLYQNKWEAWRDKSLTRLTARPLTPSSRNNEMNCHKQFLGFLRDRNIVNFVPSVDPIVKPKTVVPFPREKYKKLLSVIRRDIDDHSPNGKKPHIKSLWQKMMMRHIIMLMYGTGCRVAEVKNLQWKDIYLDEQKNPRIKFRGKNKERDIIVHKNIFSALNDWKEFVSIKGKSWWDEIEYPFVFSSFKRKHRFGNFNSESRRTWYEEIGLDPMKYQLGSFRHQFISHRLKKGRHALHIAFYCGTSVKMIEQTYGSITPPNLFEQVFSVAPEQSLESNQRSQWLEKILEA